MIRKYKPGDELFIGRIFNDAIFQIARDDYTAAQLEAWAKRPADPDYWKRRCLEKEPFVNEIDGKVVGFIELEPDGHIDCTYVDPAYARRGVMSELMDAVKREALTQRIPKLLAEVSITARGFFERHGFVHLKDNLFNVRGVSMLNYIMECILHGE
jgi:putative acetyltransferase